MTVHRDKFLENETNWRTEFQCYWYYDCTCFRQSFCPSSGVLSHTSALVYFCRFNDRLLPGAGWNWMYSVAKQICKNIPMPMYG